ncbi:DUF4401 domain-containing protein [Gilvimarinus agarilyticus]|uniref:DUF4401 domain-containing protein n=1 Tax=Gilvimarinus agarilyticus TaxID=679259 RepID=UPI0005A10FDE|nr:DUF4401 domain-containing protein [Gilvimarinus agarilyticus]
MSNASMDLAERLRAAGITVNTDASSEPENPWYVKALLALSAWLASLFLLVAMGAALAGLFDSRLALTICGLLLLAAAVLLLTRWRNDFNDNLGLALSLAGQVLVVFALNKGVDPDEASFWWSVCGLQAVLLAVPNFFHRAVVAAFAGGAFALALMASGWGHFAGSVLIALLAFVWLAELTRLRSVSLCQALGYGLAVSLLVVQYLRRWQLSELESAFAVQSSAAGALAAECLTLLVLCCVLGVLIKRQQFVVSMGQWAFLAVFIALLGAASWQAYGLLQAVVLLLLAFYGQNRLLFGVAATALLLSLSSYYYLLDTTLLIKSMTLLLLGILLLGARALFCYLWPGTKGDDTHALEVEP